MAKDSLIKERLAVRDVDPPGRLGLLLASCKTKGRGRAPVGVSETRNGTAKPMSGAAERAEPS